ncbi:SRPBCC family protein [Diaminobutyricibacter sp. McL0608]|uniref:SRPBCC family protein n=1 Tax=Leifsonia sp. McL0608 TaxID=3143537 RepID=UPI0031F31EF0
MSDDESFTIDIARSPADVFAYGTEPSTFSEWQADVVDARMVSGTPSTVGSQFSTTRRIGPADRTLNQEIVEVDVPTRWVVRGTDGPIRPNMTVTIEPLDGGSGSRVTFALSFEGHGMGVALLPMVRSAARKGAPVSYRKLKELLESRG